MEARLLARAGFQVTVVTSGVHYLTGEEAKRSGLAAGAVFLV
jgi:phosphoserine phosphatase